MFKQIGQVLAETRERRGYSLADVQAQTHIRSRYLDALEAGDFSVIPGEVYARGFLRSYARFLELDDKQLMRLYDEALQKSTEGQAESAAAAWPGPRAAQPSRPVAARPVATARTPREGHAERGPSFRPQRHSRAPRVVVSVLVVGALAAVGLYMLSLRLPPEDVAPPVAEEPPVTTPLPMPPPPPPEPEPPAVAVERMPADPSRPNYVTYAVTAVGETVPFTLRSGAACWYRATSDGRTVAEGTLAAGAEWSWPFAGDLTIHLGNPADITVRIGEEFADQVSAQQPRYIVVQAVPEP